MMRWLMTYADLITLLMIFFIILYALTAAKAQQYEKVVTMFTAQATAGNSILDFQKQGNPQVNPAAIAKNVDKFFAAQQNEQYQLEKIVRQLNQYIKENGLESEVNVTLNTSGVVVSFEDVALFPSGSASLTPQAREIVDAMARPMLKLPNMVRVEGFTDNVPIHTAQYPSNWELSTARATSVLEELVNGVNFPQQRLSATGYGEYRPRYPNNSPQNRQLNRRVDLVVLRSLYNQSEP